MGELTFVVVGEAEVYLCSIDYLPSWIASGYRMYGAGSTKEEIDHLYRQAEQEEIA